MPDIADGEIAYVAGSAKVPYQLKNVGGVYSCGCPAWRNAGGPIDKRTCKHLKQYRGEQAESERVGQAAKLSKPAATKEQSGGGAGGDDSGGDGAPPVLLAHKWQNDVDLVGWWMSEKLDGVRAWWDGKQFLSRLGNALLAPPWFTAGLPNYPLDGELWVARKEFQRCVSIVRRADGGEQWREVKYLVFDAPKTEGGFEARVEHVNALFGAGQHQFAAPVEHLRCQGYHHLKTELARVEGLGGEGLMLRQPGSKYVDGRSATLLKVKTFHDAEGRVVAHEPGKGKHKDRLGALVCEMPDGTRFNVGTGFQDKERESPPPIGAIVTYRYQELTKDGVPRFPSYVGVALDKDAPTAPTTPTPAVTTSATPTEQATATKAVLVSTASPSDDEARALVKALSEAWRNNRWGEVSAALHDGCVILRPDGVRVEGREACAASYREFAEQSRIIRYSESDHRLDVYGSTAVATARWQMSWVARGRPTRDEGVELLVLARDGERWRVVFRRVDTLAAPTREADAPAGADDGDRDDDDDSDQD